MYTITWQTVDNSDDVHTTRTTEEQAIACMNEKFSENRQRGIVITQNIRGTDKIVDQIQL